MNYIFYTIYSSYYKNGNYKNDMPAYTVFIIFTLAFFCVLLMLAYLKVFLLEGAQVKTHGLEKYQIYLLGVFGGIITYFLFYYKKKYLIIYEKFKNNTFANSVLGRVTGWLVLFLLILSPFIFIYFRNLI